MPLIGTGNVQVIGAGTWASPFYVSFTGDMAGQNLPPLTLTSTSTVANTVVTSYNADSQTATIGDNFSDYAYQYDGQGNTATVDNAGTPGVPDVVLTSVYDGMGNRKSLSASIANVKDFINNYSYDALSRLYDVIQQSQTGGNAVAPKQVYYKLDGIGDVTEVDRSTSTEIGPNPNGFANSIYSYNTLGQLTGINHESGGASVDDLTYTYDGIGRVKTFGSIDGSVTYGYDPMSELTSAIYTAASGHTEPPNLSLNFDANGNRTTVNGTSATVAPDNHLANDGTFTFGYDGAGNLISRTRISNAAANDYQVNYTWDAANRLTDVQDLNNSDTLTQQLNYTYDVYGRLIERVDDVIGGATTTVHYVWDADGMVLAFDGNGNLTTRYLNGPNTSAYDQYFATLAEEDVTSPTQQGTTTWPELDAQGSVIDVANNAGAIIDHIEYNATGAVFSESNPSVSHIGSFQGGYLDPATGMEKFGARWEEMADAVWASEDPIGFLGGSMNLSEALGNDPANAIDPTGEFFSVVATVIFTAVDTYDYWAGNISGGEYAARMAVNAAAAAADVLSGGLGGGLAVRAGAAALKVNRAIAAAKGAARAVSTAIVGASATQRIGRGISIGARVYDGYELASGIGQAGFGTYSLIVSAFDDEGCGDSALRTAHDTFRAGYGAYRTAHSLGLFGGNNRGLIFVPETPTMKRNNPKLIRALDYQDSAPGVYSDVATQRRMVPALRYKNPQTGKSAVLRLDGISGNTLIDRKTNLSTQTDQIGGLRRQSAAFKQNPRYRGLINVPDKTGLRNGNRALARAGVDNMSIEIATEVGE